MHGKYLHNMGGGVGDHDGHPNLLVCRGHFPFLKLCLCLYSIKVTATATYEMYESRSGAFCVVAGVVLGERESSVGAWSQINEVCIRLFGTVTFLSYAIIILCLLASQLWGTLSGATEGGGRKVERGEGGGVAFNCWIKTGKQRENE